MGKNCIFMQNENFLLKIGGLVLMITAGMNPKRDICVLCCMPPKKTAAAVVPPDPP